MKKIFLLLPLLFVFLIPTGAGATSGACSDHEGVDCARSQANGHVVCNDTWLDSSVLYSDMDECSLSIDDMEYANIRRLRAEKKLFSGYSDDYDTLYNKCMKRGDSNSTFIDRINSCIISAGAQASSPAIHCPEYSDLENFYFTTSFLPRTYCVCRGGFYNYGGLNGKEAKCESGESPLKSSNDLGGNILDNFLKSQSTLYDKTIQTPVIKSNLIQESKIDYNFAKKQAGKILLQTEAHGEAWYVNPRDGKRYYMADGKKAYDVMRKFGVGIKDKVLKEIETNNAFAKKNGGKIFLQIESRGEAYYIDFDGTVYYLKDGDAAYKIMRSLGLGITNDNLSKIPAEEQYPVATSNNIQIVSDNCPSTSHWNSDRGFCIDNKTGLTLAPATDFNPN